MTPLLTSSGVSKLALHFAKKLVEMLEVFKLSWGLGPGPISAEGLISTLPRTFGSVMGSDAMVNLEDQYGMVSRSPMPMNPKVLDDTITL